MRSRRLIGMLALLGVLMHAGALVRHNGLMLSALLQYQVIVADLTSICHGSGNTSESELPYLPRPTGAEFGCPICSGLVAAFAVSPSEMPAIAVPLLDAADFPVRVIDVPVVERLGLPPARGPPFLA